MLTCVSLDRKAPLVYSAEGEKVTEKLWKETKEEFSFIDFDEIIDGLKA